MEAESTLPAGWLKVNHINCLFNIPPSLACTRMYACMYVMYLLNCFQDKEVTQIRLLISLHLSPLQNVLGLLRSLYALVCVDEDAAFLRYGYLSTENASAVRKEVPKLCAELRPHALALVSSFGIPDAFLSPIAYNWVESNSWSTAQR